MERDGRRSEHMDPSWTFSMVLTADPEERILEYACHERTMVLRQKESKVVILRPL
jgi:hypothetical protein